MAAGAVIGALRAELAAQIAEFVSDMNKAGDSVGKFRKRYESAGKTLTKAGAVMSAAVTAPFLALAKVSLDDFTEQEDAIAALDAVLKSTGNSAGVARDELVGTADALQKVTRFGDEDILRNATASLLKFTNITGEEFRRANALTLDLATGMKTDLAGAAATLGKALNSPANSMKLLRSTGISLTDSQQKMIKEFVASGDIAKAQGIILDEVAKRFGGQAAAAAETTAGTLAILNNQWSEVKEQIGGVVAQALPPFIDLMKDVLGWLQQLSPETLAWGLAIGGIGSTIGPLLLTLGSLLKLVATAPAVFRAAAAAIALMGGPITLTIAAVAALASAWYFYSDEIKAKAREIYDTLNAASGGQLEAGLGAVKATFSDFLAHMSFVAQSLWRDLGPAIEVGKTLFTGLVEHLRLTISLIAQIFSGDFAAAAQTYLAIWQNLWTTATSIVDAVAPGLREKISAIAASIAAALQPGIDAAKILWSGLVTHFRLQSQLLFQVITGDWTAAMQTLNAIWQNGWNTISAFLKTLFASIIEKFKTFATTVVNIVGEMVSAITEWLTAKLNAAFDAVKAKIDEVTGWFQEMYQKVVGGSYVPDMVDGIEHHFARLDKAMVQPAKSAAEATADAFSSIVDTVSGLFDKLLSDGKITFDDLRQAALDLAKELFINPLFSALKSGLTGAFSGTTTGGGFAGLFADGGTLAPGQWGIAGERGPEPIFAGRRSLSVMPHETMERGPAITVNLAINNPIDADTFRRSKAQLAREMSQALALAQRIQ